MKVTYINREYRKTGFSIEGIFLLVKECLKDKIQIGNYDYNPAISWLKNIGSVKKYAGDVNHVTGDVNFLLLGLAGRKNLLTVHDMGHYNTLRRNKLKHTIYHFFWFYFPLKFASHVTVISNFTKQKLLETFPYPEERITVVYDPVKPVFQLRKKGTINGTPRILQIGSGKHKNLNNLLEAAKGMQVHLDIIAWIDEQLTAKLADYGIAHTLHSGLTDEQVFALYEQCDIVFFASYYEGFGMPIIEAQAVGRPVITSNFGAMQEVAGTSAVLVDPDNVTEIKGAIEKLLSDQSFYDERVAEGLKNIEKFHHQKIANDYLAVYEKMYRS
jgi:glycosyltransferase involved in cell wall biosynthesis